VVAIILIVAAIAIPDLLRVLGCHAKKERADGPPTCAPVTGGDNRSSLGERSSFYFITAASFFEMNVCLWVGKQTFSASAIPPSK